MIGTTDAAVQAFLNDRGLGAFWNSADPLQATYDQIVALYAPTGQQAKVSQDTRTFMYGCLMARQVPARKKVNGDCGTSTSISPPTGALISGGIGAATTTIGAASTVSLAATGGAGIGASAAGAGSALGGLPAVFGALAGPLALAALPFGIWAAISAHHKAAVNAEQTADCSATNYFNQYSQAIVQAVQQGSLDWRTAKTYLDSILASSLGPLGATAQSNPCNAGCVTSLALKCVHDLLVILYAQPAPPNPVVASSAFAASNTVAAQTPGLQNPDGTVNAQGGATSTSSTGVGLVVGAGAVGAHFLGAF